MMVSALPLDWSLAASRKCMSLPPLAAGRFGLIRGEGRRGLRCGLRGLGGLWSQAIGAVEYHDDGGQDHQDAICQLPRPAEGRHAFCGCDGVGPQRAPFLSGVIMSTSSHLVYKMGKPSDKRKFANFTNL